MFRYILIFFLILFCTSASANFKQIKKNFEVNNPEIIFPIPANLKIAKQNYMSVLKITLLHLF